MNALPPPLMPAASPAKQRTPRWMIAMGVGVLVLVGAALGVAIVTDSSGSSDDDKRACNAFLDVEREGRRQGNPLGDMIEALDVFEASLSNVDDADIRFAGRRYLTRIWNRDGANPSQEEIAEAARGVRAACAA